MIFVMDVDGTICFNGKFIENLLYKELKRISRKHQLIFASARPIRDLLPVVKGFDSHILIGGNGSIVSINNEISVVKSISKNVFEDIKNLIIENDLEYIIDGPFDYSAKISRSNKIYRQLDPSCLAKNINIEDITEPIKIILVNLEGKMFNHIKNILKNYKELLTINYHKEENNIDITAKNINKFTTLKKIITTDNYIAYGNDINDFELLQHAEEAYYIGEIKNRIYPNNVKIIKNDSCAVANSLKIY
ncbi:Cof-type HAD-IIB family hydrolase [Staphylococcus auricularis]|nr:HAD-IIB family hydrolase [Staphylococcus auricularis]QPT06327.1 HAD-IIB family hydrolase [Staphylococcus auricularis]BCU53274.1 Cof-type HAD-IIB family hydrolase [Staphylococcus auricularis]SQJ16942.1 hydrolase [Staphylococcus auricularis]